MHMLILHGLLYLETSAKAWSTLRQKHPATYLALLAACS